MGQAARRVEHIRPAARRASLRLVEAPRATRRAPASRDARARARASEARARTFFRVFVIALVTLAALGGARIALIVRATEMSISETRIQAGIKAQRIEGDQLEADRSSLSTPSRIENIAAATMSMGRPKSVRYITLPGGEVTATPEAASPSGAEVSRADTAPGGITALLGAVMEMSAGEAQSLLVGELGLAGSR
ncbi:MAG: hypothetical protein Q7W30_02340 [Coriobacteriia bacterium]|nr:hypothetical protein [Coriobacteriia bacterium]